MLNNTQWRRLLANLLIWVTVSYLIYSGFHYARTRLWNAHLEAVWTSYLFMPVWITSVLLVRFMRSWVVGVLLASLPLVPFFAIEWYLESLCHDFLTYPSEKTLASISIVMGLLLALVIFWIMAFPVEHNERICSSAHRRVSRITSVGIGLIVLFVVLGSLVSFRDPTTTANVLRLVVLKLRFQQLSILVLAFLFIRLFLPRTVSLVTSVPLEAKHA